MKKLLLSILIVLLFGACNDDDFLNKDPKDILLPEQIWEDPELVKAVLADLYNRYYDSHRFNSDQMALVNDGMSCRQNGPFNDGFGTDMYWTWDYGYIRQLNLFIEQATAATKLLDKDKIRFIAEGRLLRASYYFYMTKIIGGVPLITKSFDYKPGDDVTKLQFPRAKESEMYDFVISELEAVRPDLPNDVNIKTRATQALVDAMIARAAVYAGSIAKHGANTPTVAIATGEVGIPSSKASTYYQKALEAAKRLFANTDYGLYVENIGDGRSTNFANLFLKKTNNNEVIFVKDYKEGSKVLNDWTYRNQPRWGTENTDGFGTANFAPTLNLVQQFEKLDNTFEPLKLVDGTGKLIEYNKIGDVFAGRDPRLAGTVLLPGETFKSTTTDIWAGYILSDGTIKTSSTLGGKDTIIDQGVTYTGQVVGNDGPIQDVYHSTQTGFYIRKYLDPKGKSGNTSNYSDVWWIRYRYAEVLLNAAEAAFELGDNGQAVGYLNQVRKRAGFTTDLAASDMSFDRIVHERRVELAFEGHRYYDLKRWRLAHQVIDGSPITNINNNLGVANARDTEPYALIPYRVFAPNVSDNAYKYVFKTRKPNLVTKVDEFEMSRYYTFIPNDVVNANPKIVRNPFQ